MKSKSENNARRNYITKLMLELGVPAHLKGYHYIRTAVLMVADNMELVSSVTKLLYPDVAKQYDTTGQKVERAIRNAIEVSWQRGNMAAMERIFGFSASSGKGRPTNSEYIARLADEIQLFYEDAAMSNRVDE
ncbi:MAG: sporulation initiation factor Spo0A C-terminal domain-containing protein [Lachnospiraceae bacterium]|nr:sporulation initiation factor Spo0A C-terminal domain-containing protein [Lachnospiraceae bacterium]